MSRSLKKGIFVDDKLMKKIKKAQEEGRREGIKTWSRRSTVIPEMVGLTIEVYNGRKHIPIHLYWSKNWRKNSSLFNETYLFWQIFRYRSHQNPRFGAV